MNRNRKLLLAAAAAVVAFSTGMSIAAAETLACRWCREAFAACNASGTNFDTCYTNYEICRVRNRCWVD